MPGSFSLVATIDAPPGQSGPARSPRTGYTPVEVSGSDLDGIVVTVSANSISGKVTVEGQVSPSSAFVQGGLAAASLRPLVNGVRPSIPGMIEVMTQLGSDGMFRFDGVPPGEYGFSLLARQPGFYVKEARFGGKDILRSPFQFTGQETATLDVVLSPNTAAVDGAVKDTRLNVAPGALIALVPDQSRFRPELFKTATADQNGRFTIPNVAPGDYKLYAWQAIEPNGWFDMDLAKRYEASAVAVHLTESSKQTVDARLIPTR